MSAGPNPPIPRWGRLVLNYEYIANRVGRATSFRTMSSRRMLVHAVSLCLIYGATHSTATAAGDPLVRAHHLNSFYNFPPNLLAQVHHLNSFYKQKVRSVFSSNSLQTTALASSSLPIFDRRNATVPASQSCLEGVSHFYGKLNLSSDRQK